MRRVWRAASFTKEFASPMKDLMHVSLICGKYVLTYLGLRWEYSMMSSYSLFFIPAISLSFSATFLRKNSRSDSDELNIFEEMKAIKM